MAARNDAACLVGVKSGQYCQQELYALILKEINYMGLEVFFEYQHHQNYNEGSIPVHRHRWHISVEVEEAVNSLQLGSSLLVSINRALEPYSHIILNDIFPFNIIKPTHDNIARYLFNILDDTLITMQGRLKNISISEDLDLIKYIDHRQPDFDQLRPAESIHMADKQTNPKATMAESGSVSKPKLANLLVGITNIR